MDTGGPMDGLTANQCHGYASRSNGSLGQRRVNDRFLGAGFVPQKTNSRDFCAGVPPRRERPRHRTAEHTEKCASLHVQPQAQEKASRRNDKNEHFGRGVCTENLIRDRKSVV